MFVITNVAARPPARPADLQSTSKAAATERAREQTVSYVSGAPGDRVLRTLGLIGAVPLAPARQSDAGGLGDAKVQAL
jgi:hypothetical protein